MRSRTFVKKSLPCALVLLALNLSLPTLTYAAYDYGTAQVGGLQAISVEKDLIAASLKESSSGMFNFLALRRGFTLEQEKVALVNTTTHTEIIPEYSDKGLTLRFRYDETAVKKPELLIKDLAILSALKSNSGYSGNIHNDVFSGFVSGVVQGEIESPHAIAELINNARQGSPTATARWVSIQAILLEEIKVRQSLIEELKIDPSVIRNIRVELLKQAEELNKEAAKFARKQQKNLDQWKSETKALDHMEAMQEKLDDLIMKNDRKGVRQMLEAYLPWAVMEPVEANTWKVWLDAIENPDYSKTTVAFRGLKYDTDKIQRRKNGNGEIFGFMSTVLTKNQGNYTRRLRSLSTNREKNGDIGFKTHGQQFNSIKITDQMTAHARDPKASSFISFTYDPQVASNFMGRDVEKVVNGRNVKTPYGGLLVVRMDSRRMIPNISSMYSNEIELLAPLIVFPDEVVAYREGEFKGYEDYTKFLNDIKEKTGIDFASWSEIKDANNLSLEKRYALDGFDFMKKMMDVKLKAMSCSKVF